MPHLVIEYAEDLPLNPSELLPELHQILLQSGQFADADIKIRAQSYAHYTVGGAREHGFVHLTLYLMAGRSHEVKIKLKQSLAEKIQSSLPEKSAEITVYLHDMTRDFYHKIAV